jgi:ketosteroid isomerase-like protein
MEPWETAAREEIRELVARYNHLGDSAKLDQLALLFEDDAVFEIDREPGTLVGPPAIAGFLGGLATDHVAAADQTYMRHHVSNLTIDFESPTVAHGAAYWLVLTDTGPSSWGRYRDTYCCGADGRWRFARRRVRGDHRA